jgi:hypothetical protein
MWSEAFGMSLGRQVSEDPMFSDEVIKKHQEFQKDLRRENVPDLRRLLEKNLLESDGQKRRILAQVETRFIESWGVLKNRVLVRLTGWRILFTVLGTEHGVLVECFPNWVSPFSPGRPVEKSGLFFVFITPVSGLAYIHGVLENSRHLQIDFALIYHGQDFTDSEELSEEIHGS